MRNFIHDTIIISSDVGDRHAFASHEISYLQPVSPTLDAVKMETNVSWYISNRLTISKSYGSFKVDVSFLLELISVVYHVNNHLKIGIIYYFHASRDFTDILNK